MSNKPTQKIQPSEAEQKKMHRFRKRTNKFRTERLAEISAGNTPAKLESGLKAILHFVPLSAFHLVDLRDMQAVGNCYSGGTPIYGSTIIQPDPHFNFDGVAYCDVVDPHNPKSVSRCYIQFFRNGAIEVVVSFPALNGTKSLPNAAFVGAMQKSLGLCLNLSKQLGVNPPAFACLTLTEVKGWAIWTKTGGPFTQEIKRDILPVPEKMIESNTASASDILKPVFDIVWQAGRTPGMPDRAK